MADISQSNVRYTICPFLFWQTRIKYPFSGRTLGQVMEDIPETSYPYITVSQSWQFIYIGQGSVHRIVQEAGKHTRWT